MEHSALSVALLRQRLVSLLKAMPAAQAGDEMSVHQARVASRRLREALPVLGARADADALDRADKRVRRITRALGPVRELDVTLLLLAELEGKGAAPTRAIARVREAVIEERQKRRRDMLDEIKPSRLDKLRKRLVQVAAPESRARAERSALAEAAAQAAQRASEAARRDRPRRRHLSRRSPASRPHRSQEAALRARDSARADAFASTAQLNRLKVQQDLLGRMHDLEILIDRAREVQATLPPRDRRGMAELNRLIRVLEDECREGHAAYMRGRPALLKLCDASIAADRQSTTHRRLNQHIMAATIELYLVRHAIAAERGPKYPDDRLRPLTPAGAKKFADSVPGLIEMDVVIDFVLTSPLVRARETATLLAAGLKPKPALAESRRWRRAAAPGGRSKPSRRTRNGIAGWRWSAMSRISASWRRVCSALAAASNSRRAPCA